MRSKLLAILAASIVLLTLVSTASMAEVKPVALGKVYEGGYVVLYSDSTVEVDGEKYKVRGIDINLETIFTLAYSRNTGKLFITGFYNTSPTSGVSYIILYNVLSSNIDYMEKYEYKITSEREIKGRLMTEAVYIPEDDIVASMYSNSTSTYIQVTRVNGETRIYEAPASLNFYTDGDSIYAALIKDTQFQGRTARLVTGVNLVTGETVAEYPSLIPVVDLAIPLVQLYKEGGQWIGYVVVYNPTSGQLEYYRVEPGSLALPESDPVVVSPDLKYAVKLSKDGISLILPSGQEAALGYDVRPAPPTVYLGAEPGNAILDIDDQGVLLRVSKGGDTVIIYRSFSGAEKEVYRIQGIHNRLTGLYAIEDNGRIVLLDPEKSSVMEVEKPDLLSINTQTVKTPAENGDRPRSPQDADTGNPNTTDKVIGPIALVIAGIALVGVVVWRRLKGNEAREKLEK